MFCFFCNYVVSAEWGWFFFKCTDLRQSIFSKVCPSLSQQRARFEWLQSSNCELGVARPTELATPIYFLCQAHELVVPKKWGLKTLSKQVCHHYLADFFFFHASAHLFFFFFFGCWHERHCGFFLVLLWGLQNLQSSIPAAKLANQG